MPGLLARQVLVDDPTPASTAATETRRAASSTSATTPDPDDDDVRGLDPAVVEHDLLRRSVTAVELR